MAVKRGAAKRQKTSKSTGRQHGDDRLSSFPDDILIHILSCLPLDSAILTGSLSQRWCGLWKNVTSIHITTSGFSYHPNFFTALHKFMTQITSTRLDRFSVKFDDNIRDRTLRDSVNYWLRQICDLTAVRELKLTWPTEIRNRKITALNLTSSIFQMQSLVSMELGSITIGWELRDSDPINLPNLKNLSLRLSSLQYWWLEKITEACPLLEELSLHNVDYWGHGRSIKCSNQNLRRLLINYRYAVRTKIVINAPKLEYISAHASKSTTFCFDEKPIMLREANIETTRDNHFLSVEENRTISKFYEAISDVRRLSVNTFALDNTSSTMFRSATRLKLILERSYNLRKVMAVLEFCPALEVLTLTLNGIDTYDDEQLVLHAQHVSKLQELQLVHIKRVEIDSYWDMDTCPSNYFFELVKCLSSTTMDLEHFHLRSHGRYGGKNYLEIGRLRCQQSARIWWRQQIRSLRF